MKILVVASTFPASDNDSVPAFVKDQIIAMKSAEPALEFVVLAPHDSRSDTVAYQKHPSYDEHRFHYMWPRQAEQLAGRGIMPALQANPLYYLVIPALFIGEFFALLRLVRRERPDFIYAHWFTPQAIIARIVGALTHTDFVFTTHASDVSVWKKIPLLGQIIVRSNVRKARAFTAVSRRSMAKLSSFFTDSDWESMKQKSEIIPMGVNLPQDSPGSAPTELVNNHILFVGRLAEKKGVQYLLPAFSKLLTTHPDAKLTIAGDGPWLQQLKSQARSLNLSDEVIKFPGYVTGANKQSLIDSHSFYAVPSIITSSGDAEGLPVSLMEGLAAGKICIATNESGADDFIADGKNGYLVPEKDVEALSEALSSALSLSADERSVLSAAAQVAAEQFSWDTIARSHIEFLFTKESDS